MQHAVLSATWYKRTAQLLHLTEFEIAFILALFYWLDHQSDEEGEETGVPGETPDDELQKMPHTSTRRDSNTRNSSGGSTAVGMSESVGMNDQTDWQAQQTSDPVCSFAGQRCLDGNFLNMDMSGHHSTDRLKKRGHSSACRSL